MDEPRGDSEGLRGSQDASSGGAESDVVRTSRLAVAACVLAVVSLLLVPGFVSVLTVKGRRDPSLMREAYQYVTFAVSICAVLLGLVSHARISRSGGRLVGMGFAWTGVATPVLQGILFVLFAAVAGPRSVAFRMVCGTNLSGIGKAMLLYSNDYEDELPRAGGRSTQWTGHTPDWTATDRRAAFGLTPEGTGGEATISASLYLLVKYSEVMPKSFICGGFEKTKWEEGMKEFKLGMYRVPNRRAALADFWDFGPHPTMHCSYAYQMIYSPLRLTTSGEPGMAVAADRNPWLDSPSAKAGDFSLFQPDIPPFNGTTEQGRKGNTPRHQAEGQNVLFLDAHVDFERRSYCGFENDNIYTSWDGTDKARGKTPKVGSLPSDPQDSLVVNDPIVPR